MKLVKTSSLLTTLFLSGAIFGLSACGGGGGGGSDGTSSAASATGGSNTDSSSLPSDAISTEDIATEAIAQPSSAQPVLAMPAVTADGTVLELECGRSYQGTLDLRGRSNVSVRTAGGCGKAVITPARQIGGWTRYQGNIYSAPVDFAAAQVIVDGQPLSRAHWPSRAQTWASAESSTTGSLRYAMPNADLAGATLLFKPYEWAVEARTITAYSGGSMSLSATGNTDYDGYPLSGRPQFYVEGKLWMLDEPGEWVVSDGRLYVWTADGGTPEGRTWAAADSHGIDAADSNGVSIEGVAVFGAANGIHATGARGLRLVNVDIANSSRNGIMNNGGSGLVFDGGSIRNTRHDAIAIKWGGGGETIRNARIDASGTIGMPVNLHAAINLTAGSGATVSGNTVSNSGYIGIRGFRASTVSNNVVDGACLTLSDCGGIFLSARDGLPLNSRIEGNTIRRVGVAQRLAWGVYLSDGANAVTVAGNTIAGNGNGMQLFDSHDNTVSGNTFSGSTQAHIQMAETVAGNVRRNRVSGNSFSLSGEESYRISSDAGSASVLQFAGYDLNRYAGNSAVFANFNGEALSYSQWRARTGQDAGSTYAAQ